MMSQRETHEQALRTLLGERLETDDAQRLTEYLVSNSNLPGPRGNLELAAAFMDVVEGYSEQEPDRLWELCAQMAQVPADAAPVNDPQEIIPFCGAIGIGAIGSVSPDLLDEALAALKRLANDPRWRMREAMRMGLQRVMSMRRQAVWDELGKWIPEGSLLELRAAAAAVAEPALLKDGDSARLALKIHQAIVERALGTQERKSSDLRVLRKALGYTLSIVVHANPQDGFEFMAQLARSGDLDAHWIVRENLKKSRLVKNYPKQAATINKTLQ